LAEQTGVRKKTAKPVEASFEILKKQEKLI
jgi:hypothetical protein